MAAHALKDKDIFPLDSCTTVLRQIHLVNLLQTVTLAIILFVPINLPQSLFKVGSVVAPIEFCWKFVAIPLALPPGI